MPIVFFYSYGAHRDLHSFPTRRSSDLDALRISPSSTAAHSNLATVFDRQGNWRKRSIIRSEEHTSELQSHSDLVCRLLLEKKNTVCPSQFATRRTLFHVLVGCGLLMLK